MTQIFKLHKIFFFWKPKNWFSKHAKSLLWYTNVEVGATKKPLQLQNYWPNLHFWWCNIATCITLSFSWIAIKALPSQIPMPLALQIKSIKTNIVPTMKNGVISYLGIPRWKRATYCQSSTTPKIWGSTEIITRRMLYVLVVCQRPKTLKRLLP